MRIRALFRKAPRPVCSVPEGDGRYAKWAEEVSVVDGPFPGRPFTSSELAFACRWAVAQREYGIIARLLPDVDGAVRVLCIAGGANIPAEWVIYPDDNGIRSDESSFGSVGFSSLADALSEIREMPEAQEQAAPSAINAGHGLACA